MNSVVTFEQLWSLAKVEAAHSDVKPAMVFDPIGLLLFEEPTHGGYDLTPQNSVMFAHTGGDGVHFSFLFEDEGESQLGPIIMTVPANRKAANIIVGEDLHEFLCRGCRFGYFSLEKVSYLREGIYEQIQHPQPQSPEEERLLAVLRKEFSLEPWKDVKGRLTELKAKYLPLVVIQESESWTDYEKGHPLPVNRSVT